MIAPLAHLPRVPFIAALFVAGGLIWLPQPSILRPWSPRYRDAAIACAGYHCDVDRARVRTLLETRAGVSAARFVPSFRCGGMAGIRLYALRPGSLLARLGLRNGDRVERVNGIALSSPDTALRLYSSIRNARHVELEVERNGRPVLLTYTIR
jgi:hypothetical protein